MKNIKLLICYHKPATLFKDEILTPIHVGRANACKRFAPEDKNFQWLLENMIGDDTGENISEKNGSYNEMTSLYWAWKNYDKIGNPDYIGLMHYRRHFVFREDGPIVYNIEDFNQDTYLDEINYSIEKVNEIVEGCDFVAHIGKVINVYNHYIENHRQEDLDLAVKIMLEKHPEYETVTKEYFAGDYSNFCNMFIFSKKIFFKYCEWIFDILEEFENRVDVSEKRFFISERLTGIFIADLMRRKELKYKVLPISFIDEPIKIPIALPINENNVFQVVTTLTSILESAKGRHQFQFYILYDNLKVKEKIQKISYLEKKYKFCNISFIYTDVGEEYYPLYLSELLGKENKCVYLSGNAIALHDLSEFYTICSTDDYYVVGTPLGVNDAFETKKRLSRDILVLNSARLRKHHMWELVQEEIAAGKNGMQIFNEFCENQIGYIPWYFITRESEYKYKDKILADSKARGQVQQEATWRAWVLYDNSEPWLNSQGVYSIFWWDFAVKVPTQFEFVRVNKKVLEITYTAQQKEINTYERNRVRKVEDETFDWRGQNLWWKLKFFYRHNGLKKTITYSTKKAIKVLLGKDKISHA